MKLDALGPQEVVALELATGVPLVYDIASDGSVASKSILEHS
jgi:bisphosphoglycerate-dependent phosphoglycerate mutase